MREIKEQNLSTKNKGKLEFIQHFFLVQGQTGKSQNSQINLKNYVIYKILNQIAFLCIILKRSVKILELWMMIY